MGPLTEKNRSRTSPPQDDRELVERLKALDETAFEAFVEQYQDFIFNLCYRLLSGGRELVADAAQEVFLHVWRGMPNFKGEGKLSTWIYTLTTNVCRDQLRKRGKHQRIQDRVREAPPEASFGGATPVDQASISESTERLFRAMEQLSPEQSEVLVLKHAQGLSYDEISKILNVGVDALKMRASRGREQLRRLFEAEGGEIP